MRRGNCSIVAACLAIICGACGSARLDGTGTGGTGTGTGGSGTGGISSTGGVAGAAASTGGASGTAGAVATGGADGGRHDAGLDAGPPDAKRPGILLTPSATGFVQDPTSGVVGAWYPFGDGIGPNPTSSSVDVQDSDCMRRGGFPASVCSMVEVPLAGQPFAPDATGAMCTRGVAALVQNGTSGSPDYSDLWGAGIAFDFNNPGGDAGVKGPWNASGFTGIAFDVSGTEIPNREIRVLFPFIGEHGTDAPYYQGASLSYSAFASGAHIEIHWTDVGGPMYLTYSTPPVTPPIFDPTQLLSIQFQVFTNTSTSVPYAFCVANLTLLRD
jgi:hypothetical protein